MAEFSGFGYMIIGKSDHEIPVENTSGVSHRLLSECISAYSCLCRSSVLNCCKAQPMFIVFTPMDLENFRVLIGS